jgi:hypothetical protein
MLGGMSGFQRSAVRGHTQPGGYIYLAFLLDLLKIFDSQFRH